jgi:hypothetical protein
MALKTRPPKFTQAQFHYWNVMAPFNTTLTAELERSGALTGTWTDPKRRLEMGE